MASVKRVFTLRLDDTDYEKMRQIAANDNRSMANCIETLVKQRIEEYERDNGVIVCEEDR